MLDRNHCPAGEFEAEFTRIYNQHMKSLPICNSRLQVRAIDFQPYRKHWIGALVTPWSILVVLARGEYSTWPDILEGKIAPVTLPAGQFSFLGMKSERLGSFLSCSLMSPVDPLYNQRAAENFAARALNLMLSTSSELSEKEKIKPANLPQSLSRRDFFSPVPKEVK